MSEWPYSIITCTKNELKGEPKKLSALPLCMWVMNGFSQPRYGIYNSKKCYHDWHTHEATAQKIWLWLAKKIYSMPASLDHFRSSVPRLRLVRV
jgi:hypothetical protein